MIPSSEIHFKLVEPNPNSMKKGLLNYLHELSIVILGISIAFAINKWSANNKDLEKEKVVMETILSEIENNNFYVNDVIRANDKLLTQYDSVVQVLESSGVDDVNLVLTVSKLLFQDSGMDLAISIGVLSNVDFTLARKISFCYKLQQNILDFEQAYFDYLEVKEDDRKTYYRTCRVKVSNFNNALKTLDQEQKNLQEEIEKYVEEKF